MKKILFSLFAIVLAISSSAQNYERIGYGAKAGLNIAMLTEGASQARLNYNAGVFVDYDFSVDWSVELGVNYSRQGGCNDEFATSLTETNDMTLCLDYINLPLVAKFYPIEGMNVFLGPQFSFLVNAEQKIDGGEDTKVMSQFEKFDIGIAVGVGYEWENGMIVSGQYNIGLRDIYKGDEYDNVHNSVFQLSVGWRF